MQNCDILIRGGTVVDGTGTTGYAGDVAIAGDRIVAVGDCSGWRGAQVIDATGRIVAPGFIDVHTHDDVAVLETPAMPFKITQGVTTIIAGNCGISAAPLAFEGELPAPFTLMFQAERSRFPSVTAYRQAFAEACRGIETGTLRPTLSGGIAESGNHAGLTVDSILAVADKALYRAKAAGRDRIVMAGKDGEAPAAAPSPAPVTDVAAQAA